jgi:hypothetical protein
MADEQSAIRHSGLTTASLPIGEAAFSSSIRADEGNIIRHHFARVFTSTESMTQQIYDARYYRMHDRYLMQQRDDA